MIARIAPALCGLLGLVLAPDAAAAEQIIVGGSGRCPAPDRVRQAIFELTADRWAPPMGALVEVGDGGETFTVVVRADGERGRRAYADADRDCERRVRIAAVFAVTTLFPPQLAAPEPPAPPPRTTPARTAPARIPPRAAEPWFRLELGAFGEVGAHFADPTSVVSWGGELRGALGGGPLAATAALSYAPRAKLAAPELDADLARITALLGVRVRLLERPIDLALDAGPIGALLRLRGVSVLFPAEDHAVELGFRAGLVATPRRTRGVAPFVAVHAACFPAAREIAVAPRGVVAHTPLFYGGVTLGVALGL